MACNFCKTGKILLVLALVWSVFAIGYFVREQRSNDKQNRIERAYEEGVTHMVKSLMAEATKCKPVSLDAENKYQVIALECFYQEGEDQPAQEEVVVELDDEEIIELEELLEE